MDGSAGRPKGQMNVLGSPLASCSHDPVTGFFRDGCCNTSPSDRGLHTVCAIMTDAFLEYSKAAGNDLSTPHPEFGFPGLKAGDQWCLCAARWEAARAAGKKALRDMRLAGKTLAAQGRSMLIFPQGTRIAPGVDHPYEIGVFALYEATGLPVVPVALNSGHVWPRNSWIKYPGLVTVEFLDPIDPGLDRKSFMATLKQRIEDRMEILDAPIMNNQEKA